MVTGDRDEDEGPGKDLAPEELAALLLPHAAEHAGAARKSIDSIGPATRSGGVSKRKTPNG